MCRAVFSVVEGTLNHSGLCLLTVRGLSQDELMKMYDQNTTGTLTGKLDIYIYI